MGREQIEDLRRRAEALCEDDRVLCDGELRKSAIRLRCAIGLSLVREDLVGPAALCLETILDAAENDDREKAHDASRMVDNVVAALKLRVTRFF